MGSQATRVVAPPREHEATVMHNWQWAGNFWQCVRCFRVTRSDLPPPASRCTQKHKRQGDTRRALEHKCLGLSCSHGSVVCIALVPCIVNCSDGGVVCMLSLMSCNALPCQLGAPFCFQVP